MMKLIITGVSGFIGKNFLENLPTDYEIIGLYYSNDEIINFCKEKNINIKLYKCDLTDSNQVKELSIKIGKEFDKCLFLASNTSMPLSRDNPRRDFELTVFTLVNFLTYFNVNRFIYMSTAGVYDGLTGNVTVDNGLDPTFPYCISKLAAEYYVKFYKNIDKIKEYVILRFGGAFGKYSRGKFVSNLISDINSKKERIEIYGEGNNIINVMYVNDVVRALRLVLESSIKNLVCDIGAENFTINEIITETAKAFNDEIKIIHKPKFEKQKYMNFKFTSDFDTIFNFKRKYTYQEGVIDYSNEFK